MRQSIRTVDVAAVTQSRAQRREEEKEEEEEKWEGLGQHASLPQTSP